jgi:rhodanese-related sulfurtransferase
MDLLFNQHWLWVVWVVSGFWLSFIYWQERGLVVVSIQKAVEAINRHNALVLDFRPKEQFDLMHIPASRHVESSQLVPSVSAMVQNKKRPLILLGEDRQKLRDAATLLSKAQYESIAILAGGVDAWKEQGFPLNRAKTNVKVG